MKESGRPSGLRRLLSRMFRFRSRSQEKQQLLQTRMPTTMDEYDCNYRDFEGKVLIELFNSGRPFTTTLTQLRSTPLDRPNPLYPKESSSGRSALLGSGPSADTAKGQAPGTSAIAGPARVTDGGRDA